MESAPGPETYVPQPSAPLTPSEERTWAMLAHLSILLNLVSGILGVAAPFVIYLIYKDRSRYVAYHSLQSLFFQMIFWVGGGVLAGVTWALTGILAAVVVGLLCIPIALLVSAVPLAAIVYAVIGGIQCSQGQDFRYWLVGDWVRGTLTEA